jgi:hypothetical protein
MLKHQINNTIIEFYDITRKGGTTQLPLNAWPE